MLWVPMPVGPFPPSSSHRPDRVVDDGGMTIVASAHPHTFGRGTGNEG